MKNLELDCYRVICGNSDIIYWAFKMKLNIPQSFLLEKRIKTLFPESINCIPDNSTIEIFPIGRNIKYCKRYTTQIFIDHGFNDLESFLDHLILDRKKENMKDTFIGKLSISLEAFKIKRYSWLPDTLSNLIYEYIRYERDRSSSL